MTDPLKLLLCSNTSDRLLYKSPSKFPQSSFCYVNDYLWHRISYGIQFLTPQWVFGRLSSKSIIFLFSPQWTLLVVTLTIYLWKFLPNNVRRRYQFSHGVYDQVLFSPVEFILFTVMSSLSPLNGRNSELGGFSIGYVHITFELTDSQVSSFSQVGTTPYRYVQVITSERQGSESSNFQMVMSILPLNRRMPRSLPFMVLKLSSPV